MSYGAIFKECRLNRGFSLKQVANQDLSVSQLSRFERGESDLSLEKFMSALEAIGLTISEFMDKVNHFQRDDQRQLMSQMARLHYAKDVAGLEELLKTEEAKLAADATDIRAKLNVILFRGMICQCDEGRQMVQEDLDFLSDYLFQKEVWEIADIILIGNFYTFYSVDFMARAAKEILKNMVVYGEHSTYRNLVEVLMLNMMEICTERGALVQADFFQAEAEKLLRNERHMYHRIIFLFERGFLRYAKGDQAGIEDMENAIFCFEVTGSHHHAQHYRDYMKKHC